MNPILKQLGFGERDRALIIHADDIGMLPGDAAGDRRSVRFRAGLIGGHDGALPVVPADSRLLPSSTPPSIWAYT